MSASKEALEGLLRDIEQLETWWYRTRQTLIEQGFIGEERAWEPDWAPWEGTMLRRVQNQIDELDRRQKQ